MYSARAIEEHQTDNTEQSGVEKIRDIKNFRNHQPNDAKIRSNGHQ